MIGLVIRRAIQTIARRIVAPTIKVQPRGQAPLTTAIKKISPIVKRVITLAQKPALKVTREGKMTIPKTIPMMFTKLPFAPAVGFQRTIAPVTKPVSTFISPETDIISGEQMAFPAALLGLAGSAISAATKAPRGRGLGGIGSILTGRGQSQVIAVGRKYILRQHADGRLTVSSRTPRRRFATRSRGTQMEKMMQMLVMANMARGLGGR